MFSQRAPVNLTVTSVNTLYIYEELEAYHLLLSQSSKVFSSHYSSSYLSKATVQQGENDKNLHEILLLLFRLLIGKGEERDKC